MNLHELAELLHKLNYPMDTEIVKATLEIRLQLPGGITTVFYEYPDPDSP